MTIEVKFCPLEGVVGVHPDMSDCVNPVKFVLSIVSTILAHTITTTAFVIAKTKAILL